MASRVQDFTFVMAEICTACGSVVRNIQTGEGISSKFRLVTSRSIDIKRHNQRGQSEMEDLGPLSLNYPETVAKDTKKGGYNALNAAFECKEILAAAEKPIDIAKKIKNLAIQKTKSTTNPTIAFRCEQIAKDFGKYEELASEEASNVDFILNYTENAGNVAIALAEDVLFNFEHYSISEDRIRMLKFALRDAEDRTIEAKKAAYNLLKSMKKCCERKASESLLQDSDDETSPLIARDRPTGCCEWMMMIVTIIIGIFGCAMFSLIAVLNTSKYLGFLISAGIVAVMWVLGYIICKIFSSITRRKRLSEFNKRDELIQSIEEQLSSLREYFEQNNIPCN